jgi:predicted PhzF superfamily epimerase YddE/YHI9
LTRLRLDSDTVIATAPGGDADVVLRVFAPKLKLPEDPVCGTAHRILGPLWSRRLGRSSLASQQLSPRGGHLFCRHSGNQITIAGDAVLVSEGSLMLP